MPSPKAVVLLSGGMDSATTLAIARSEGFECLALAFAYGQRHRLELEAARRVAARFGARLETVTIDLRAMGGSALTADIPVPKDRPLEKLGTDIPVTYVPARNTIFLSFALGWAEVTGARDIFLGVNALDYSGYPDCRPEYIAAFEQMANLGTRAGTEGERFTLHAPLIRMTKREIVARGLELGVDFGTTVSCYDPGPGRDGPDGPDGPVACGRCDACILRLRAFAEVLGASDVFIGVNALDYSGYPDCRPEYIAAYERMANLATKAGVEGRQKLVIHTPLIALSKADIIRRGLELGVDYAVTRSCYDPSADGKSCGQCDSCQLRLKGFAEVGTPDPAPYQAEREVGV